MLIHLGSHEYADRGQLDQIRGLFALSRKNCQIPISNAHCQIKSILSVVFDTVQLLDEWNHRLSVLCCDAQGVSLQLEVVSDSSLFLKHRKVCMLGVFGSSLALVGHGTGNAVCLLVLEVKLRKFAFQNSHPAVNHDLLVVQSGHLLRALEWASSALETAAWATLEELLGCGSWLEFGLGWNRVWINFGRVICRMRAIRL